MTDLADAAMVFPADLAGAVTVGVASPADAGMAFPADPAGAVTVGVAGLADVVDVPECGGGDARWDDRILPGNWSRVDSKSTGRGLSVCQLCGLCSDGGVLCGAGC